MHHDFVQVEGRKHPVVRAFLDFYDGLEEIVGREKISVGKYRDVTGGPRDPEYDLKGLDESTKSLKIVGRNNSYRQEFYVTLTEQSMGELEEFLKQYTSLE